MGRLEVCDGDDCRRIHRWTGECVRREAEAEAEAGEKPDTDHVCREWLHLILLLHLNHSMYRSDSISVCWSQCQCDSFSIMLSPLFLLWVSLLIMLDIYKFANCKKITVLLSN